MTNDPALLILLAIIGGLPATIAAIGAIVIGLRNSAKVAAVATAVDGVSSKLVAATERAASAEGLAAGIASERANPQSPVVADPQLPVAGISSPAVTPVKIVQDPAEPAVRVKPEAHE